MPLHVLVRQSTKSSISRLEVLANENSAQGRIQESIIISLVLTNQNLASENLSILASVFAPSYSNKIRLLTAKL